MQPLIKYPGYFVTEDGHIWSSFSNKFLNEVKQNNGYLRVYIKGLYRNLARLVAETYHPNPNDLPQVNHKDEVKTNNHKDNLEWCSRSYNQSYSKSNRHRFISPEGSLITVFNLREFCRQNNLDRPAVSRLIRGIFNQHKGWKYAGPN